MKNFIKLFIIIFILSFYSSSYAGWAEDWLGTAVSENPSSYEGQQRGYFTGGGFTARKKMHTDYLLSIQAPRLNIGCGGIDIFLGSFSFLNPDYLVEKATRIIQTAPMYAFELALSNLCQSCDNIMAKIQAVIDRLNNLQLDECKAAKTVVTIGAEMIKNNGESQTLNSLKSNISSGIDNFFTDAKKEAQDNPTTKIKEALNGVNATIEKLKNPTNKSFLETYKNDTGIQYISEVRALVGDVYINWDKGLRTYYVAPCSDTDIEQYVKVKIKEKPTVDGPCVDSTSDTYDKKIEKILRSILNKMKENPASYLTEEEQNFINFVELPIVALLRDELLMSDSDAESIFLDSIIPTAYNYAYGVLNSIYNTIQTVVDQININIALGNKDNMLDSVVIEIEKMNKNIDELKKKAKANYNTAMKNFNDSYNTKLNFQKHRDLVKKMLTESLFRKK